MEHQLLNAVLAFLEGFTLILSPCVLPILPILLSGSMVGTNKRPYGIIAGFILFFSLFTLFTRKLVLLFGLDLDWLRDIALILIMLFGVVMVSNYLSQKFSLLTQGVADIGINIFTKQSSKEGFWSGFIFGGLISLIWTPCAGPALAAAIVQTVTQETSVGTVVTIVCFALGSAVPMFVIAIFSRRLVRAIGFLRRHSEALRKILGTLIILTALLLLLSANTAALFQPKFSNQDEVKLSEHLINPLDNPYRAPEIKGITAWLNSDPLSLQQLRGKVVLLDFWTYSCVNCVRTLPYLKDWYQKYHDKGLVIIGIHSPEFEFEKKLENVQRAIVEEKIPYPVALDNNFGTWLAFHNRYWPAHYLIDPKGFVVYQSFGEGDYQVTENNIRVLLGLNKNKITSKPSSSVAGNQTPETYLGYERASAFYGAPLLQQDQDQYYSLPSSLPKDGWAMQGKWFVSAQSIAPKEPKAILQLHFYASKVYTVAGNTKDRPVIVNVMLNGEPIPQELSGKDVQNGKLVIDEHRLYEVVNLKSADEGSLQLIPQKTNVAFYTFTFG